jgi:hypothetical protein
VNALLVPTGRRGCLAGRHRHARPQPSIKAKLRAAGRQIVEKEFASAQIGRQIVAVYDHLMGRSEADLLPPQRPRG